ncbi:MAG: UDP-N-acetylglucosamine 2-epimerase, partial [Deltaproteobacteria bacterium]|nr:UDP-N-acetylglucosamine 2-epimerase [Deltaproteobacteria bacterium]
AVDAGAARLVGTDRDAIVAAAASLLDDPSAHAAMRATANPFGDGQASARIVAHLAEQLCVGQSQKGKRQKSKVKSQKSGAGSI